MTTTTIKVSRELRDRLKIQAQAEHRTLGDHLAHLAELDERQRRFEAMRRAIARTSSEDLATYRAETAYWDTLTGDGIPTDDAWSDNTDD